LTLHDVGDEHDEVPEQLGDTRHSGEEGPTPMSSTEIMPMPMRLTGSVAPDARVRVPWLGAQAPVSAGLGLGLGSSFVCVTKTDHQDHATEINAKAYGTCRLPETST
jgi:hypothetical protein